MLHIQTMLDANWKQTGVNTDQNQILYLHRPKITLIISAPLHSSSLGVSLHVSLSLLGFALSLFLHMFLPACSTPQIAILLLLFLRRANIAGAHLRMSPLDCYLFQVLLGALTKFTLTSLRR